jgi:peptidoglycan-N-acetylglucosamine deacetylase
VRVIRNNLDVLAFVTFAAILSALPIASRGFPAPNPAPQSETRTVAVTVDDLPGAVPGTGTSTGNLKDLQSINTAIPRILKAHHAPAIGFVNEWKLEVTGERDARVALLQEWIDAGLDLGNHTYTHANLFTMPLPQYEDEVIRGEVVTRTLMKAAGKEERYFRHPFLGTGPTAEAKVAFEEFLKVRGYRVAPVTVDNADWQFNDALGEAHEKGDEALALRIQDAYLAYMDVNFAYYEDISRSLFHREIAQILLIHDSELTAECLDALLTKLEKRGYRFISLEEALRDPAYQTPDLFIGPQGFSWLLRWKMAFGQKADWQNEPDPPAWIIKMSHYTRHSTSRTRVRAQLRTRISVTLPLLCDNK